MTCCNLREFLRLGVVLALLVAALPGSGAAEGRYLRPHPTGPAQPAGTLPREIAKQSWTLPEALNRAFEANPDVVAAKYDVERQEGARLQVLARILPSVTASANVNEREPGLEDRQLDVRTHEPVPPSPYNATALFGYDMHIEVRQVVFDGLSSWNLAKRQTLLAKQSYLALRSVLARTAAAVRQGFDAILLRTASVEAERRRVDEYVQLVEWTSRKQAVGDVPEFELLRAEAELEGARADLAEAERALGQAEQSFRRLLQISEFTGPLQLIGEFAPRAFSLPLDEAIGKARANRPDLQAAALAVEAARRSQLADSAGYLPKVEAFASYGTRTSYYSSSVRLNGWTYGLSGQWNLFEGGASRGRRMSLRADRRGAEAKLAETEQGIVSKLHELYQGLQQSRVALEAQEKSVSMSARASRDARRQYEVGSASLEQVLQAGMTYRRADSRRSEAIYNYNSIVAEIEFSIGGQVTDLVTAPETWKR